MYTYLSNPSTNHYTIFTYFGTQLPPYLCMIQVHHYKYLPWLPICKRGIVDMLVTLNYIKYIHNISVAMVLAYWVKLHFIILIH